METNYPGIDYSLGQSNLDKKTGIHYGVLPSNCEFLTEFFWDSVESYYTPFCPKCDNELTEEEVDNSICNSCEEEFYEPEYADEPSESFIDSDGVKAQIDSHFDIFIFKSDFYSLSQFCSPCAPGAGYLLNSCKDGIKTYCLGPDWFTNNSPPYPVYSVKTGEKIYDYVH